MSSEDRDATCGCCGDERGGAGQVLVVKAAVRRVYGEAAERGGSLGCGSPLAAAAFREGEIVLDLGSGRGGECLQVAAQVGRSGRVIGVDMTPEMIEQARRSAAEGGHANVEFRLGEIEHLPVADASVDVVISNCVINLSPEKEKVFGEIFRALRPGGRLSVMDVVAVTPIPAEARGDMALWASCVAGAETSERLEEMLRATGFEEIRIEPAPEPDSPAACSCGDHTGKGIEVTPALLTARKPARPSARQR